MCCCDISLLYYIYPKLRPLRPIFNMLQLRSSEVSQLLLVFKLISSEHDDHKFVNISNTMAFFNVGENKFMNKAFSALCRKDKKYIDFKEFVMLVWFFCTIGNNLGRYCIEMNSFL
mgnify:CR=1 FL=1